MTDLHPACPSAFYLISATVIYNDSSLIQKCTCVLTSWEESKEEGEIFWKLWLNDLWARRRKAKLNQKRYVHSSPQQTIWAKRTGSHARRVTQKCIFQGKAGRGLPAPPGPRSCCSPHGQLLPACLCNLHTQPRPHSPLALLHPPQTPGLLHPCISIHHVWLKKPWPALQC